MRVMVLAVPDCPNAMLLEERLAQVLDGRCDVSVSRQVVGDEQEAGRLGMHGSPTILVDGTDPFAEPGQRATVSCRLYRDSDGRVSGAPSVRQLRQVIGEPAAAAADAGGSDAVWHPRDGGRVRWPHGQRVRGAVRGGLLRVHQLLGPSLRRRSLGHSSSRGHRRNPEPGPRPGSRRADLRAAAPVRSRGRAAARPGSGAVAHEDIVGDQGGQASRQLLAVG
jgi:hypothetical protein